MLLTLERHANKKGIKERLKKEMEYIENAYNPVRFKNFLINDLNKLAIEAKKKNNMTLDYIIDIFLYKTWNEYDSITNAISSFRLHPERTYLEQSKERLRVDKFGEGYLDQIILWEKNNSNEFWELKKILKEDLGLLHSIRSNRKMGGGRFEILVQPKENSTETSLFDVGFGINQFTPIIVADLQLGEGSTLYIAEPEIHLHPNVQAKLGNYLAKQVETNKKNYVIETHSEYLINRIRYLITEKKIKESDLAVYYLENNSTDVKIHKIKFGLKGEIIGAPPSFFETYLMDIKNIALNAIK